MLPATRSTEFPGSNDGFVPEGAGLRGGGRGGGGDGGAGGVPGATGVRPGGPRTRPRLPLHPGPTPA